MKKGYHPCLIKKEELIPNDVIFEEGVDIMLITGPNMAGTQKGEKKRKNG